MKVVLVAVIVAAVAVLVWGYTVTTREPAHLYKHSGRFAACPKRPSCVSSLAPPDSVHFVEPLQDVPQKLIVDMLRAMGGKIQQEDDGYVHALFVTPRMRFHDDVELKREGERWLMRSISRFAYRDFGVNRARLEDLRWEIDRQS